MEFNKVLVPVSGGKADEQAIKLACSFAKKKKGKIYVVYVIQVGRALPLDTEIESERQKGEEVLEHAERMAEDQDYQAETELLQAREVGPAIVEEAVEHSVDLVIIGIDYKMRFGEFELGSITPYVLRNAPCRVLLCREPALSPES